MIEKEPIDHLYKYIEIDDDVLEFINSCPIQKMFSRLSGISQLGLASKIFPSATHTKLEHNLGVYFLSDYLVSKAKLSSDLIEPLSFKVAAIIHGTGHFPFSFATEVGLQKVAFLNKNVADFIAAKISPVVNRITKDINSKEQKKLNNEIFKNRGKINHFYRFFTANLLLQNEEHSRQIFKDSSGFNFDELLKYLALPQNIGFQLLHHIDRLDYILRDMFHLGLIRIDLNLSFYFANLRVTNKGEIDLPPEWKVLDKLESYAVEKIYNDSRVKTAEAVYQKILSKTIFDQEIALADLLEWEDKEMESRIKEYQQKKNHKYKILEQIDRIKGKYNSLPTYSYSVSKRESTTKNLLLIEGRKKIIGNSLRKDIGRSTDNGTFTGSYLSSFDDFSDIHVKLVCLESKEIRPFLIKIAEYDKYYKISDKNQIAKCIWGDWLEKIDYERYRPILTSLKEKMEREKGLTTRDMFVKAIPIELLEQWIAAEEVQQMTATAFKFTRTIDMQKIATHSFDGFITNSFLLRAEERLLDEKILSLFQFSDREDLLSFVEPLRYKRVTKIIDFKGRALEYYTYLKKICEPEKRQDEIKKWVFPSTITKRGEIDVWGLHVFKNKKPSVELVECSTTTAEGKKLDAIKKLKQKRAVLQERFENKIETKMFFNDDEI